MRRKAARGKREFIYADIKSLPRQSGTYRYYDCRGRRLYDGSSKNLRRRVEDSLRGRGDYRQVRGRKALHEKVRYFTFRRCPIERARRIDRRLKSRYSRL